MRNPLKSKLIVGVLCIVLAAAVAFVGIPALNRTKTSSSLAWLSWIWRIHETYFSASPSLSW